MGCWRKLFTLVLLVFLLKAYCVSTKAVELVILHTNDVHSRIEQFDSLNGACSAAEAQDKKCFGGVARRQTQIKAERAAAENVLLLDAGDEFLGSIWFNYYQGKEVAQFLNMMEYDAMALGHHEYDFGVKGLSRLVEDANFTVLSCNLASTDADIRALVLPSTEIEIDGEQVGIIGYSPQAAAALVNPVAFEGLQLLDQIEEVQKVVDDMTSRGINKIIALGHQGFDQDVQMAKVVKGIDVIVGGRTNTFLYTGEAPSKEVPAGSYPYVVNATFGDEADNTSEEATVLIVQDYAYGKYLGKLVLNFDDEGRINAYGGNPILLDGNIAEDEEVLQTVTEWKAELNNHTQMSLGTTRSFLDGQEQNCRMKECNLGNLVTDAMIFSYLKYSLPQPSGWSDVSIALWNSGGIRDSIPDGDVTLADILTVFPFHNTLEVVYVKGSTLKEVLEHSVENWNPDNPSGSFLQVAGLEVEYDVTKKVGQRVRGVNVRCSDCWEPHLRALDEDATYGVLLSGFLLNGGDGYTMIQEQMLKRRHIGRLATDTLAEYIQQYSPIMHGVEGRINFCDVDGCHVEPLRDCEPVDDSSSSAVMPVTIVMLAMAISTLLW